jgi:nucleoside-diphosphate-sugar epimerase
MTAGRRKIVITGAAGLVGQNLIPRLKATGEAEIVAIDKHPANVATLRRLQPDITVLECDLALDGPWRPAMAGTDVVVIGHAQIGGTDANEFVRNNQIATSLIIESLQKSAPQCHVVHISSSVVNSKVTDWYTESKTAQERLVANSGLAYTTLRPTLMFGWFDRKHLGWLARFMQRSPVFPIPGYGRFLRQPLYAGDFCGIVAECVRRPPANAAYDISGLEKIDYIDLIKAVREAVGARTLIIKTPYLIFWVLLKTYAFLDRDPPFTTKQLEALVTPEVFDTTDWPRIFGIPPTPLKDALRETFAHPVYSKIELEF